MKFNKKIAALVLATSLTLGGLAFAAQTVFQTVSSVAGTEFVELFGLSGPSHLVYGTTKQMGPAGTAFSQANQGHRNGVLRCCDCQWHQFCHYVWSSLTTARMVRFIP